MSLVLSGWLEKNKILEREGQHLARLRVSKIAKNSLKERVFVNLALKLQCHIVKKD